MTDPFNWPEDLVGHASSRNLMLLVGAGVSHSCVNDRGEHPPLWPELIMRMADAIHLRTRRPELEGLIDRGRLLDAAELLRIEARACRQEQTLISTLRTLVDGTSGHSYVGGRWHDAIVKLEPSVIVTTNYDKIIERATSFGYSTHEYESATAAADVRRNVPVLLKIHGSVDHMDKVILSRKDYTDVRLRGERMLDTLRALFLTRPALLIGYSLQDPDLQLILENVFGGRNELPSHYVLCEDQVPDYEAEILRYSYGINTIKFPTGRFDVSLERFEALAELVSSTAPA